MSSSAAQPSSYARPGTRAAALVSPFPYDELPLASGGGAGIRDGAASSTGPEPDQPGSAEEARSRQVGREEGRAESRKNFDQQLAAERAAIAAALAQFRKDRGAYYAKVETEIVQLSLAIARKILHREAQVDPLLLAGVVRVALEKIEGATAVSLRLNPSVAADWQGYLARHMEPEALPRFVEDAAIAPERCVLETSMGTAQLGIELQLKEIEDGFMDLLAARPKDKA